MLRRMWYGIGRVLTALYALFMLKVSIVFQSPIPEGAFILAANHPSTVDPAAITLLTNRHVTILIRHELFKIPLFGRSLRLSGHVPVVRGCGQAALDKAEKLLKAGHPVAIFPEGEITPKANPVDQPTARSGVARLALSSGAPVIPVGIHLEHGRRKVIETRVDGVLLEGYWYLRGPYAMTVGEPMSFSGSVEDRERVRKVTMQIMNRIVELSEVSARRMEAENLFPLVSKESVFAAWRAVYRWSRGILGVLRIA